MSKTAKLTALTVCATFLCAVAAVPAGAAEVGIASFDGEVSDAGGGAFTQAGGHPYGASTRIAFNRTTADDPHPIWGANWPVEPIKDVVVDLPPGLIGNPAGMARCTGDQLAPPAQEIQGTACPAESQVGVATITVSLGLGEQVAPSVPVPVYNMSPPPGVPARFAMNVGGTIVTLDAGVRSGSDYGVTVSSVNSSEGLPIVGVEVRLWGVPADPAHDGERYCPGSNSPGCASSDVLRPFLTNPTACTPAGVGLETRLRVDSWVDPGDFKAASFFSHLPPPDEAVQVGPTGCDVVPFDPSVSIEPTSSEPDAPTGLDVELAIPQDALTDDPDAIASAHLKRVVVRLPEGMGVSPSAAHGLQGCSLAQIKLGSDAEPDCPNASKIGTVEVVTPLLDKAIPAEEGVVPGERVPDPLTGSVYLAAQGDNPFGSLLGMYIVAKGPGVVVKLAGRVDADLQTGRLTTTFDNNPQLPFSSLRLTLKDGPRAPLVNPPTCGPHTVEAMLSSWARPGEVVERPSQFVLACPGSGGFSPTLTAGTANPTGGQFSPFALRLERPDRQQILSGLQVVLPQGLTAKLAGVPLCPEELAGNEAVGRCPAGSRIGTVAVSAGPGSTPFSLSGDAYLTGPYKGAPYGLSVQIHAKAGPLDLGLVKVRQGLRVDPTDAHVTVASDPLPTSREGIPFRLRTIDVNIDRPGFVMNPTSCAEKRIEATATSTAGALTQLATRFRATGCAALPFKPRLAIRLTGRKQTRTGGHPGIKAQVDQTGIGEAGIRNARVRLPKALALDPDNAQALCEFADGTKDDLENHCPKGSIVGRAKATSPLLNRPLTGNAYFVKNVRRGSGGNLIRTLPMIVVALRGEIAINLKGTSSTTQNGQLINTFADVPDAPIKRFNLNITGGNNGILTITRTAKSQINLCTKPNNHTAAVAINSHNGKRRNTTTQVKTPCATKAKTAKAKHKPASKPRSG